MIKIIIWTFLFVNCAFLFPVQIWWPELAAVIALLCPGVTSCANNNCRFFPWLFISHNQILPKWIDLSSTSGLLRANQMSALTRSTVAMAALLSFVLSFGFECATDSQYRDSYISPNLLFYKKKLVVSCPLSWCLLIHTQNIFFVVLWSIIYNCRLFNLHLKPD